jgi:signal transduction histidine kinase
MSLLVPEKATTREAEEPLPELGEALESLRQFIGAAAGWVCLRDATAGPTFPVRRGEIPESWLRLQQSRESVWGFAVREGPTLINDLRPWAVLGEPPLRNLLSCPLGEGARLLGHVALVNKSQGFASQDAAVLQGMAHHMLRLLGRLQAGASPRDELSSGWRRILDRASEGVLLLDEAGTLLYANATWLAWTGFRAEDLLRRQAPFPFWVSQHDLVRAISMAAAVPTSALPFRRQDQSLLWCQVETVTDQFDGRRVTVAFLQRTAEPASVPREPPREPPRGAMGPLAEGELPFGVALTDSRGRLIWFNNSLGRLMPSGLAADSLLRFGLAPVAAAILEHLIRELADAEPGRMGSLVLQSGDHPLTILWLTVHLTEGVGFLFALTNEPEGFPFVSPSGPDSPMPLSHPTPSWLALLLGADGTTGGWGPRWEKLTGLSAHDVEGSRGELVLDWLFPQQTDRERVADCLHQPDPVGCQFILELATPAGSRPLLCTFLPLPVVESARSARWSWLLLVGEPELFAGPGTPSRGFVRQFAQGLHRFLLHQLRVIDGLARTGGERTDLSPQVANWFVDIDSRCRGIDVLLEDLTDLARETAGERSILPLADLVRAFFDERTAVQPRLDYELRIDLSQEATLVRVNPQLLRVVLRQLISNAEQALSNGLRRIEVRVAASGDTVRCEIHDTGAGLPTDDWTLTLAPFFSTKGAFAQDPPHAALEGTGLGLTVSRHLLALHEGQLELRSVLGEGTTAIIILPRAVDSQAESRAAIALSDTVRFDPLDQPRGPHQHGESPSPTRTPSEK